MKKIILYILLISLITFFCYSFLFKTNFQSNPNTEILGKWKQEDEPNIIMVFTNDHLVKDYINGELSNTYHWQITTSTTPSGLHIDHLLLSNINDPNESSTYEISALNNEFLTLVFQKPGGGIGSDIYYIRQ